MRTRLFILAAALAFAACNEEQPTAPVTSKEALAADQSPSGQIIAINKTRVTVTVVQSAVVGFGAPNGPFSGDVEAVCPAGSQVVGGGYTLTGAGWTDLKIYRSAPHLTNAWEVGVANTGPYAGLQVYATCVQ